MPQTFAPIVIADQVWIAADAFIGPGVQVGEGAVIGARSSVFEDVEPWTVVGGNPAKFIKKREIKGA
jgi:putative colanic acid biosynthesis acetyltransferase WcaF